MPKVFECRDKDCNWRQPARWKGRCPGCNGFYNFREVNARDDETGEIAEPVDGEAISLKDVVAGLHLGDEEERIKTLIEGLDLVLGGGIFPGSRILLCGSPGCGKSTLLLEAMNNIAKQKCDVLYVTGEESLKQIGRRAERLKLKLSARLQILHETDLYAILDTISEVKPRVAVIDSMQTLFIDEDFEQGGMASIKIALRETEEFMRSCEEPITFIFIGHITKDGGLAGPKALEHFVDVNLYFQGNKTDKTRNLRCDSKNRHGDTPISYMFEMTQHGLIKYVPPPPPAPPPPPESETKPSTKKPKLQLVSAEFEPKPKKPKQPRKKK